MNWNTESTTDINALLLVAHPDDETIFCGGTMLYYLDWSWMVVCMTWREDTERYRQFRNAMDYFKSLGVKINSYLTIGQNDTGPELIHEDKDIWKSELQKREFSPDIVFTHNTEGEYGHHHHKLLNTIVHELFSNVWEFICPGAVNVAPQPFKSKINTISLNSDILNKKTEIFNRCYTSELANWKNLPELMLYEFRTGPEIFTSD